MRRRTGDAPRPAPRGPAPGAGAAEKPLGAACGQAAVDEIIKAFASDGLWRGASAPPHAAGNGQATQGGPDGGAGAADEIPAKGPVAVDPTELPAPQRELLNHRGSMTATLERHWGEPIGIQMLEVVRGGNGGRTLGRRIVLLAGSRPVELGVIRICLDAFNEPARTMIESGSAPFGAVLRLCGVACSYEPRGFFSVAADDRVARELDLPEGSVGAALHGRVARLTGADGARLADVVEVLPPHYRRSAVSHDVGA